MAHVYTGGSEHRESNSLLKCRPEQGLPGEEARNTDIQANGSSLNLDILSRGLTIWLTFEKALSELYFKTRGKWINKI